MDDRHFDALARGFERRGLLGTMLLAAGLGGFATLIPGAHAGPIAGFCTGKPKGSRCRNGGQCCSGRCKKKKGQRKGKCQCSPLQAHCSSGSDCCLPPVVNALLPECLLRGDAQQRTCCMEAPGHCREDADCCGIAECAEDNGELRCIN